MNKNKKVLLIVRDGWGYSANTQHNFIAQASTPYTDELEKKYPSFLLRASGEAVGLPEGKFGNSEVGHMTLGAGRVLLQSLARINSAIFDKSFFENKVLQEAVDRVRKNNSKLHIIGLLQKEGVHASFDHIIASLEFAKKSGLKKENVFIHVITDGRDAPRQNAYNYVLELQKKLDDLGIGKIVSFSGRYFAMDRNENWDRVEKYYSMLMGKPKDSFLDFEKLFRGRYSDKNFSDEFLEPISCEGFPGVLGGDSIIFTNFRKDRAQQLAKVFCEKNFSRFNVSHKNIFFMGMTEYYNGFDNAAFADIFVENTLGDILEKNNKTQLRIAETEKYAHVTFFFDGGQDKKFKGEKKILIPSPKVKTFDLKPEMAAAEITERLLFEIKHAKQDFILCNYANADMVGHSGNHRAIKEAVSFLDSEIAKIIPIALKENYAIVLTADHGNAEHKHGVYETSHTTSLVPATFINCDFIKEGEPKALSDISAIILHNLNI